MIYLITQMALALAVAALLGGAAGWLLHRARQNRYTDALHQTMARQQRHLTQAQEEVALISEEFDELKEQSRQNIEELEDNNKQIPVLTSNLEKSQLLVRQMIQRHDVKQQELMLKNQRLLDRISQLEEQLNLHSKLEADRDLQQRAAAANIPPQATNDFSHPQAEGQIPANSMAGQQSQGDSRVQQTETRSTNNEDAAAKTSVADTSSRTQNQRNRLDPAQSTPSQKSNSTRTDEAAQSASGQARANRAAGAADSMNRSASGSQEHQNNPPGQQSVKQETQSPDTGQTVAKPVTRNTPDAKPSRAAETTDSGSTGVRQQSASVPASTSAVESAGRAVSPDSNTGQNTSNAQASTLTPQASQAKPEQIRTPAPTRQTSQATPEKDPAPPPTPLASQATPEKDPAPAATPLASQATPEKDPAPAPTPLASQATPEKDPVPAATPQASQATPEKDPAPAPTQQASQATPVQHPAPAPIAQALQEKAEKDTTRTTGDTEPTTDNDPVAPPQARQDPTGSAVSKTSSSNETRFAAAESMEDPFDEVMEIGHDLHESLDTDVSESVLAFDPVDQHDDLQQIFGIGPVTEKALNKLGITSYSQLAELKQHEIERIAEALEIVPGRIERDNWVGSARRQLEEVLEQL